MYFSIYLKRKIRYEKSPDAHILGGVPGLKKTSEKPCPEWRSNPDCCGLTVYLYCIHTKKLSCLKSGVEFDMNDILYEFKNLHHF